MKLRSRSVKCFPGVALVFFAVLSGPIAWSAPRLTHNEGAQTHKRAYNSPRVSLVVLSKEVRTIHSNARGHDLQASENFRAETSRYAIAVRMARDASPKDGVFRDSAEIGTPSDYPARVVKIRAERKILPHSAIITPSSVVGGYRLSGERVLRPTTVVDDGIRTYIEWGEFQPLPAVFGIGPTGKEEVVDGYMREGKFTIDRVYNELIFRMDDMRAKAHRYIVK